MAEFSFKFNWPDILKPEIPGLSTLKRMAKHEPVVVLRISDQGRSFNLCEMMMLGKWIFDDMKGIRYMVQHESVNLRVNLTTGKPMFFHAYICDDDTATTVTFTKLLSQVKDLKIDAVSADGTRISDTANSVEVPANIKGYSVVGSTISLVSDAANRKWYSPGADNWSSIIDNKAVSDLNPKPMPWGWVAVGVCFGFFIGAAIMGIPMIIIGKVI
jgi:hypothetical protein